MKKLIPFTSILFIVLLFAIGARFIFFVSYLKSHKIEFRKNLLISQAGNCKQIQLVNEQVFKDGNGLEWKENNKELVIQGIYHEVVSIKKTLRGFIITVIEDKLENELFASYFQINKQAKNSLVDLSNLFFSMNYLQHPAQLRFKLFSLPHNFQFSEHQFIEDSFTSRLLKPPGIG